MGPQFGIYVVVASLIVVSCLINYLNAQHVLKQANENGREQLELCLAGLTGAIAELEGQVVELARRNATLAATVLRTPSVAVPTTPETTPFGGAVSAAVPSPPVEIPPEILVVIAAAVTSFLGRKVRIRSARMLQSPYEIVNPWAQQGRVIVQASHTLRSWGRSDDAALRSRRGVRP